MPAFFKYKTPTFSHGRVPQERHGMLIEIRDGKIQVVVQVDEENESIEWVTLEQIEEAFKQINKTPAS